MSHRVAQRHAQKAISPYIIAQHNDSRPIMFARDFQQLVACQEASRPQGVVVVISSGGEDGVAGSNELCACHSSRRLTVPCLKNIAIRLASNGLKMRRFASRT